MTRTAAEVYQDIQKLLEKLQFNPRTTLENVMSNLDFALADLEKLSKEYAEPPAFLAETEEHIFAAYTLLAANLENIV